MRADEPVVDQAGIYTLVESTMLLHSKRRCTTSGPKTKHSLSLSAKRRRPVWDPTLEIFLNSEVAAKPIKAVIYQFNDVDI
jgi:hypothetical protein